MLSVTWYGHACVGIEHDDGLTRQRLIMDPFSPDIHLGRLHVSAPMVTYSHTNPQWHSWLDAVEDCELRIPGLTLAHQPMTALGFRLTALPVFENADRGGEANAMVFVEVAGVRLAHFGDLGQALNQRELAWLRPCDVWFALAGGEPTIALDDLAAAWQQVQPKVMIPIHFGTPALAGRFAPIDALLSRLPDATVRAVGASSVEVSREALPNGPEIWILEPVCDSGSGYQPREAVTEEA